MTPFRSLIICTSPRSGSTLLCDLLAQTQVAGHPKSYFHHPSIDSWAEEVGLQRGAGQSDLSLLRRTIDRAVELGTADTGIFGLRMQRGTFPFFADQLGQLHPNIPTDRGRIEHEFGRTLFIHLSRQDKLAQAVSLVRALQSGLWHGRSDGTELERLAPHKDPTYDASHIRAEMDDLLQFEQDWQTWFADQGIDPLPVTYDALSKSPAQALRPILTALGKDPAIADSVKPGVRKLADATSAAWIERFKSENGAGPTAAI